MRAAFGRGIEQGRHQRAAEPGPTSRIDYGEGLDLGVRRSGRSEQPGVADDLLTLPLPVGARLIERAAGHGDEVDGVLAAQLGLHHRARPRIGREHVHLESHDRGEVVRVGGPQSPAHPVTRLGAESVTSGERR